MKRARSRAAKPSATDEPFRSAIDAAEHLSWKAGLGATTRSEGKDRIDVEDTTRLLGSACIDEDCPTAHPNAARWDYVLGYARKSAAVAYFVESHSAETSEVAKMKDKLDWLLRYLEAADQKALKALPREIHWLASGRVNIPVHTRQYKLLKTTLYGLGLRGPVTRLKLT